MGIVNVKIDTEDLKDLLCNRLIEYWDQDNDSLEVQTLETMIDYGYFDDALIDVNYIVDNFHVNDCSLIDISDHDYDLLCEWIKAARYDLNDNVYLLDISCESHDLECGSYSMLYALDHVNRIALFGSY